MLKHLKDVKKNLKNNQVILNYKVLTLSAKTRGYGIDRQKIAYCECLLLWLYQAEAYCHDEKPVESIVNLKQALKLCTRLPDHHMAIELYLLTGRVCLIFENYKGANKAFGKARDVAEDMSDLGQEMRTCAQFCRCLIVQRKFDDALKLAKRCLQIAWIEDRPQEELIAFELIATCHFYMRNIEKCKYYLDRVMRGKLELKTGKTWKLNSLQHDRRMEDRQEKVTDKEELLRRTEYNRVTYLTDKALSTVHKINKRSREGFYQIKGKVKDPDKLQFMVSSEAEENRLKKVLAIYSLHDLKFDKMSLIRRVSTPPHKLLH